MLLSLLLVLLACIAISADIQATPIARTTLEGMCEEIEIEEEKEMTLDRMNLSVYIYPHSDSSFLPFRVELTPSIHYQFHLPIFHSQARLSSPLHLAKLHPCPAKLLASKL